MEWGTRKKPQKSTNSIFLEEAKKGNVKEIERLLKDGANVNARDEDGWTALHFAALNGHVRLAALLVKNGAMCEIKDNDGNTPFMIGAQYGRISFLKELINKISINEENNDGENAAMLAAYWEQEEALIYIIDRGGALISRSKPNINVLTKVAHLGSIKIACICIENGVSKDAEDYRRTTPIQAALEGGQLDMFNYLKDCGAIIKKEQWTQYKELAHEQKKIDAGILTPLLRSEAEKPKV